MNIRFITGSNNAYLYSDYKIYYRGDVIKIPKGFIFDGASIPPIFWGILMLHPFHMRCRRAGMVHDYMYTIGKKDLGDKLFKSILKEDGCNSFQSRIMFWAVRLFGGMYINERDV